MLPATLQLPAALVAPNIDRALLGPRDRVPDGCGRPIGLGDRLRPGNEDRLGVGPDRDIDADCRDDQEHDDAGDGEDDQSECRPASTSRGPALFRGVVVLAGSAGSR